MSLACIDRHILETIISSIHDDFEVLAAVNKSIIGITACLLHLKANPKGVCIFFIPKKATDDMMHECKKHFSAQLKSKTILFYHIKYASFREIYLAWQKAQYSLMHGKIYRGSNINSTVRIVFLAYEDTTSVWARYRLVYHNCYDDPKSWIYNVTMNDLKCLLSNASPQLTINILTKYKKYTSIDTDELLQVEQLSRTNIELITKIFYNWFHESPDDERVRLEKFDYTFDSKKLHMLIKLLTVKD